ncbi:drug/metabolite exporter YedA [Ktedonosporobacter rubrisoli]|uniref:Drug/metabolite exporter YedA n=1 Tax=Ktedonosporobacter rubrisoli TaxID=2509675 RepID=A0A4P6JZP3_KTERU|nr:drug/metabolite exporter YedA [Ktedonosporobacter rubrisoli]QBD80596.1 drug/metabolite exporter YedA [Ktedonosporobacter rubrisoli]
MGKQYQTESLQSSHHYDQEQTARSAPLLEGSSKADKIGIGLALLALYLIWGSTYLVMRVALQSFPPYIMGGLRFLCAGVILYVILRLRGSPAPTRKEWLGSALIGILMLVGSNGSVSIAEQWVSSGISAVALAAVPLWTAFFVGLFGRWPSRQEWVGLVLGFAGVILLNLEHGMWTNPFGAALLILAPVSWSLGSALSPRFSLPAGLMSSAAQMLAGGAAMLLLGLLMGQRMHSFPTVQALGAMAYLVLFGSLLAYSAYTYLLKRVRTSLATSYAYVNPVVAVALGVGMAGEHITLIGILAMLVILTGVGLVSLRRKS